VENVLREGIESTAMKVFGVEISIISVKLNFKSMVEAIEKVIFEWPIRLTAKTHVQIGPPRYSTELDGIGVYYTLVDMYFEGRLEVHIGDLYCTSRKLRYRFHQCKGNLKERRDDPGLTTRLVCQNCGETYPAKDRDQLAEKITADLRRKGKL
jgi:uncharacterized protein YbaR (Trm112 family)